MHSTNKKLTTCATCDKFIAKTAKQCPHCGAKAPSINWGKIAKITLVLFVIACITTALGKDNNTGKPSGDPYQAYKEDCYKAIYAEANNPSTVEIQRIVGVTANQREDGSISITQTFSAKNSFNLEQKFIAYCLFKANGEKILRIEEQKG